MHIGPTSVAQRSESPWDTTIVCFNQFSLPSAFSVAAFLLRLPWQTFSFDRFPPAGVAPVAATPWHPTQTSYPSAQLTWNCWAISTLLLAILAGGYIAFNVLEELDAGELASEAHEKLNWTNVVSLGFAFCFILSLGAARPLKGGKGYDFKEHAPQELAEALSTSAQKLVKIAGMVVGTGSACFRLFADNITALIDLYNGSDWSALCATFTCVWSIWCLERNENHIALVEPRATATTKAIAAVAFEANPRHPQPLGKGTVQTILLARNHPAPHRL